MTQIVKSFRVGVWGRPFFKRVSPSESKQSRSTPIALTLIYIEVHVETRHSFLKAAGETPIICLKTREYRLMSPKPQASAIFAIDISVVFSKSIDFATRNLRTYSTGVIAIAALN